jgi:hypothetical protein
MAAGGRSRLNLLDLPLGVADPMFMCELAELLGMPVSEVGDRMSNYELNVTWPAYFAAKRRIAQHEADRARSQK